MTKILGGDSHSCFSQIKDKNSLSPYISYLLDTNLRVEYSSRRRIRATTLAITPHMWQVIMHTTYETLEVYNLNIWIRKLPCKGKTESDKISMSDGN